MSVDLSKLRIGDTIELRDGTRHVVTGINCQPLSSWPFEVDTEHGDDRYTAEGRLFQSRADTGDIVRILPRRMYGDEIRIGRPGEPGYPDLATVAGGVKHDGDKPALALLPFRATEEVAKVLAFGAKKYDAHNWRKGFAWSRLMSASLRHLFAFARGEDKDAETGLSHLAHAACCVLFLLEHELESLGTDDRYKGGAA